MTRSKIEWTEYVWNFILGCTKCGLGCERCFAIREVGREWCQAHEGLAVPQPVPNWTKRRRFRLPESHAGHERRKPETRLAPDRRIA